MDATRAAVSHLSVGRSPDAPDQRIVASLAKTPQGKQQGYDPERPEHVPRVGIGTLAIHCYRLKDRAAEQLLDRAQRLPAARLRRRTLSTVTAANAASPGRRRSWPCRLRGPVPVLAMAPIFQPPIAVYVDGVASGIAPRGAPSPCPRALACSSRSRLLHGRFQAVSGRRSGARHYRSAPGWSSHEPPLHISSPREDPQRLAIIPVAGRVSGSLSRTLSRLTVSGYSR